MNRSDIVNAVKEATDLSSRQADEAVASTFEHIANALARGESLSLVGFGSFVVRARAERAGRNPQTGEAITIAASNSVGFKPGKGLKDSVNA